MLACTACWLKNCWTSCSCVVHPVCFVLWIITNTSESGAVSTPFATCQKWLMSGGGPSPPLFCFPSFKKNHAHLQHALTTCTHTDVCTHTTDSWDVTPPGYVPKERGKMDRQGLSARMQWRGISFLFEIMNHMRSVSSAPIRSDVNYPVLVTAFWIWISQSMGDVALFKFSFMFACLIYCPLKKSDFCLV